MKILDKVYIFFFVLLVGLWYYMFLTKVNDNLMHISSNNKDQFSYDIQYIGDKNAINKNDVNTILSDVYCSLKLDYPNSDTYRFNSHDCTQYILNQKYLYYVLNIYKDIYYCSNGLLDPTIEVFLQDLRNPESLYKKRYLSDTKTKLNYQTLYDKKKDLVGYDYVMVGNNRLKKLKSGVQINVDQAINACQLDMLSDLLKKKGIKNYKINIGNETVIWGERKLGKLWPTSYYVDVKVKKNIEVVDDNTNKDKDDDDDNDKDTSKEVKTKTEIVDGKININLKVKKCAVSVITSEKNPVTMKWFNIDDLKHFSQCAKWEEIYIHRCNFAIYKYNIKFAINPYLDKSLQRNLKGIDKALFNHLNVLRKQKTYYTRYVVPTDYISLNKTWGKRKIIKYETPLQLKNLLETENNINNLFSELIHKLNYRDLSRIYSFQNEVLKKEPIETIKEIKTLDQYKMITINPKNGQIVQQKDMIIAFVFCDNSVLAKGLTTAFYTDNFKSTDDIISKIKHHTCAYFVLYYDENGDIKCKESDTVNVDIKDLTYNVYLKF